MKLKGNCPKCNQEDLKLERACCGEREKGWLLIKACAGCGYSERWDPKSLFQEDPDAV